MNSTLKDIRRELVHRLRRKLDRNPLLKKSFMPDRGHNTRNRLTFQIVPTNATLIHSGNDLRWDNYLHITLYTSSDQYSLGITAHLITQTDTILLHDDLKNLLDDQFNPVNWVYGVFKIGIRELNRITLKSEPWLVRRLTQILTRRLAK